MDSKALLVVLLFFVLAIGVWAIVSKRSEKFNDGNNNGNGCGSSMRYSSLMRMDKKNYGNEYNIYPDNGYWNWQSPENRFLGCLNGCMVNTGTSKEVYDECVKSCKGV
jgi:hypothetical protein